MIMHIAYTRHYTAKLCQKVMTPNVYEQILYINYSDRVQILGTVLVYSNKDMAAQVVLYSYTIILNLENEETSIQFNF